KTASLSLRNRVRRQILSVPPLKKGQGYILSHQELIDIFELPFSKYTSLFLSSLFFFKVIIFMYRLIKIIIGMFDVKVKCGQSRKNFRRILFATFPAQE